MANYMTFFPVGNGDMTLIQTKTNKYIMIDCNIRNAENDDTIYDCTCCETSNASSWKFFRI